MSELIDRQAAIVEIAKLEKIVPYYFHGEIPSEAYFNEGLHAAMGIIQRQPTASPWHRAEEKPVPYEWVWGVYSQTVCGKTFRHHKTVRNDGDHIIDEDGNIYDRFITHWMYRWPLPKPSKEDQV